MINRIAIPLVLSLVVSGCGLSVTQREATTRFAAASSGLGEFSANELSSLREATIQMNTKDIAIGGMANIQNLDGAFNLDDVSARINAAMALSSYGSLLLALVDETQEAELKSASTQFVDSVKGVRGKTLNDAQLEGLGTVVYSIGGFFIEYQKAEAVKKIVKESKADIDHICDLLIQDFSRTGLALFQDVDKSATQLKADSAIALASSHDVENKLIAIEAFKLADDQKAKAKTIGDQAVATLKTLKLANAELANSLDNDSQSLADVKALGVNMKNLGLALKVFSGH
jgi:hypothetical protein